MLFTAPLGGRLGSGAYLRLIWRDTPTVMLDTWRLLDSGAIGLALANVLGSTLLGVVAVVAGVVLGRAVAS